MPIHGGHALSWPWLGALGKCVLALGVYSVRAEKHRRRASNRFAIRFVGEYSQIDYTFTGQGNDLSTNLDGDATTQDVFGATDRAIGGAATLAVLY
jgi:hypothetical protein